VKLNPLAGLVVFGLFVPRLSEAAGPPPGYYASAEGKAGAELRLALHNIIHNQQVIPYSSSTRADTGDALGVLDANPLDTNYVVEIYSGSNSPVSSLGLTTGWDREHQWCNSYGINSTGPAYSDLHNLRAIDYNVNSSRGNKYYDVSNPGDPNYKFPAFSEAPLCSSDTYSWEPPLFDRGNIARSLFYMAIRYTGDSSGEPLLVLTDNTALIQTTNHYMGKLGTLLAWHNADPVDAGEQLRNDRVYSLYQLNRNPFVDHPEWVNLTFAPAFTNSPVLSVSTVSNALMLHWLATNQSCHLQFSTNLTDWQDATTTPTLTNSQFDVVWTNQLPTAYFRLRAQ
jgi:endonuclease I